MVRADGVAADQQRGVLDYNRGTPCGDVQCTDVAHQGRQAAGIAQSVFSQVVLLCARLLARAPDCERSAAAWCSGVRRGRRNDRRMRDPVISADRRHGAMRDVDVAVVDPAARWRAISRFAGNLR